MVSAVAARGSRGGPRGFAGPLFCSWLLLPLHSYIACFANCCLLIVLSLPPHPPCGVAGSIVGIFLCQVGITTGKYLH